MTIQHIKITDFQGLPSFESDWNGQNADVSGTNGKGKTTIANAISWILTNKAQSGEKGFDPQPLDKDGNRLHGKTTSVEMEIELEDGTKHVLRKDNKEKWVKSRETRKTEYKGNTNDYFFDGKAISETKFMEKLEGLFGDEDHIRMLISPSYFASTLDWRKRRSMLMEMAGDISDEEVFLADDSLADLKEAMAGQTIANFRIAKYIEKTKLYEEKKAVEIRIDESSKTIDKTVKEDKNQINADIAGLDARSSALMAEKEAKIKTFDRSDIKEMIQKKQIGYAEAKAEWSAESAKGNEPLMKEISQVNSIYLEHESALTDLLRENARAESRKKSVQMNLDESKARYAKATADAFVPAPEPAIETICPYCGQPMPAEKIESAKKAFADKEEQRHILWTQEHDAVIANCSKLIADLTEELAALDKSLKTFNEKIEEEKTEIEAKKAYRAKLQSGIVTGIPFEETEKSNELIQEIESLKAKLVIDPAEINAATAPIDAELAAVAATRKELFDKLTIINTNEVLQKRIAEHMESYKKVNSDIERTERLIELADKFVSVRAGLLDKRIAAFFPTVRFRFFENLKNGGIADSCVPLISTKNGMIPYEQASTAERINGGLEIVNTLSAWCHKTMPVLIDNAESVVLLQPTRSQQVRFRVSPSPELISKIALI